MNQTKTGVFIQQLRKEHGMTQRELADILGISDKTVSKWETGKGMPDMEVLLPLCNALDIKVNELLSGEKLSSGDYSEKAEENMMRLLKENETNKVYGKVQIVLGSVLGALAVILLFLAIGGNILWFFDFLTFAELLMICAACVLISGARGIGNVLTVVKKSVIPVGVFLTFSAIMILLGDLSHPEEIGGGVAVALLSIIYSLLIYIILVPICYRYEKSK